MSRRHALGAAARVLRGVTMYIAYANTRFSKNSQLIIEQANQIIDEYQEQGFSPRQPLNSKGMRLPWVLEEIHRR